MTAPRRNQPQHRQPQHRQRGQARPATNAAKSVDLWRPVAQLPDVEPVVLADDPTLLLRSLGDPPLMGRSTVAGHYIATVVERAAGLASALAASAELLARTDLDEPPP